MHDYIRDDLAAALREADRLTDVADWHANDGDHKRAAATYSRALGILIAAVDTALDQQEAVA